MASHRYWRAVAMEAYGTGDLELSAFYLLDIVGSRLDAPATLTASVAPITGSVSNLQDSDLTTAVLWSVSQLATLSLNWDFVGSPVDAQGIQLAGDSNSRFPLILKMQYSDDSVVWVDSGVVAGIAWPGVGATTTSDPVSSPLSLAPSAYYQYEETSGTVVTDSSGFARNGAYISGVLPSAPALLGQGSRAFATSATQYHTAPNAVFSGSTAFSLSFIIQYTTTINTVILERGGNSLSVQVTGIGNVPALPGTVIGAIGLVCGQPTAVLILGSNRSLADGAPHVVQIIYSPVIADRYCMVDGVDCTLRGPDAVPVADGAAWQIGSRLGATGYGGTMDELAFYPRALSVSEARAIYYYTINKLAIKTNKVAGRVTGVTPVTVGAGPTILYGIPQIASPVNFTVESGSVKDYTSGVLGAGRGRVAGTTKEKGTPNSPVMRRVRLIRERDGLLMRELWSNPITGAYSFEFVDELQKYTVLSYDHNRAFRAVVADGQIPELIP